MLGVGVSIDPITEKAAAQGDPVAGLRILSKEYFTSLDVTGVPFENFNPFLRVKMYVVAFGCE